MTKEDMERIKAYCEAATPGPFTTDEDEHDAPYQNICIVAGTRKICSFWMDDAPVEDYNAAQRANVVFLTQSRTDLPACVAEIERLQAELEKAKANESKIRADAIEKCAREIETGGGCFMMPDSPMAKETKKAANWLRALAKD